MNLEFRGLSVEVGPKVLLYPTDLEWVPGEWKALIGPNGAGKSTLLKAVATLLPSKGQALVDGKPIMDEAAEYRRRLGVVLHESLLYTELTAFENLYFYARVYGVSDPSTAAMRGLEEVGLKTVRDERVGRFSRGMTQRLALARAWVHRPDMLLLDEPLAGIDASGTDQITKLFCRAKERGTAGLWVTHRWETAWSLVDEVLEIEKGHVVRRTRTQGQTPDTWRPLHHPSEVSP